MDIYGVLVDTAGAGLQETGKPVEEQVHMVLTATPNPFSEKVIIRWVGEAETKEVTIRIFDACGRIVKKHTVCPANIRLSQTFVWDTRDNLGNEVSAGIYFVVIGEGEKQRKQTLLLLK